MIAQLGRGGMAEVYLAVGRGPAGFNKLLVLKQLTATLSSEPDFLAMFLDEARLAARLNHPNIVQTNEVGQDGGKYFIAMEYLDGQPLVRIFRRPSPAGLPIAVVLRIIADACAGLHYAHTMTDFDGSPLRIVHRDVSPHNLFITYGGHVKVVDFGIAKAASRTTETETGLLKGKIAYMSPEHIRGAEVDGRSDIFSLGIVLYEAVTRQRLWGRRVADLDILRRLINNDVPFSPRAVAPDVPEEVDRICRRALAPEREDRYATAQEMQEDIEQTLARLGPRASEREVGALVAQLFAEERQAVAAIIERQMRLLDTVSDGERLVGSLPKLGVNGTVSLTGSSSVVTQTELAASMSPPPRQQRAVWAVFGALIVLAAIVVWAALFSHTREDLPRQSAAVLVQGEPTSTALPTETSAPLAVPEPSPADPGPLVSAPARPTPLRRAGRSVVRAASATSNPPSVPQPSIPPPSAPQPSPSFGPLDGRK